MCGFFYVWFERVSVKKYNKGILARLEGTLMATIVKTPAGNWKALIRIAAYSRIPNYFQNFQNKKRYN